MNRRDILLNLVHNQAASDYVPAAFFMHFDAAHQQGQAAIDKHLEFFHQTGMDFVKIQYEQIQPPHPPISRPEDWMHVPLVGKISLSQPSAWSQAWSKPPGRKPWCS